MTRRMIDSSIWYKESFVQLPPAGRLLQIGMINHADDQGRLIATPFYLKGQIFPGDNIAFDEIQSWLEQMHENGTIILYTVSGRQYAQFANWWDYQSLQYAQPSKFPRPEGWTDRIRRTATKGQIVTFNWYTVDKVRIPDTGDSEGNPLPKVAKPHTNGNTPPSQPVPPEPTAQQSGAVSPAHSGESTGERTILTKEELEDQSIGGDQETDYHAHACETIHNPPPKPMQTFSSKPNEYLPGLPDPRLRKTGQVQLNERVLEADRHGVTPECFRALCDELLTGFGKKARAYAEDDGRTLNHAQQLTLELIRMNELFRVKGGIERVFQSWRDNDYRGDSLPTSEQFMDHASLLSDGRVVNNRRDKNHANGNNKRTDSGTRTTQDGYVDLSTYTSGRPLPPVNRIKH